MLITLPERRLAGWAKGEVVSEELWNHTVSNIAGCYLLYSAPTIANLHPLTMVVLLDHNVPG